MLLNMDNQAPIGIFDSGIGGLTVARAINEILPAEQLIYFGDTAHLPYGEKSAAAIQAYSIKITDILISRGCKVIVIACNSASSAAYELLKEYSASRAKIINVIDPMVQYVSEHFKGKKVGLIGTKQTILSNVYAEKLNFSNSGITVKNLATPLLVPMIEEGFIHGKISHDIIMEYLNHSELSGIASLILGCTHYPLIKDELEELGKGIKTLASSEIVAKELRKYLDQNGLISPERARENKFMVSDFTDSFEKLTKLFFGKEIHLEKYALWE